MPADLNTYPVQHNGQTATAEELAPLAFSGFAHFTALQVRDRKIRGLDLHLDRLRTASLTLFGQALPDDQVRACIRSALAGSPEDVSLTATLYSPAGEFTAASASTKPDILIRTGPAAAGPQGPLALKTFEYERTLPSIKHVGEIAKTHFLHQAIRQGFDDAAFIDRTGCLSEGSIWNLVFWDGSTVIWPAAAMLTGTTMGIVRRQLDHLGIPQRTRAITLHDLPDFTASAVMNSWTPGIAVHQIDAVSLPDTPALITLLHQAYQAEPPVSP